MEKVITCPVCKNTDNCFEEVQETFSSYLCFSCGFMSDSRYEIGMIYPEGTKYDYVWKYAKLVDIPKEERVNYDNYSQRLDVENAETFSQFEFINACKAMGITKDMSNG